MSFNYSNATAHQILDHIKKGGRIDQECIASLTAQLDRDWVIDLNEAEFLFQVNQAIGERDDEMELWTPFFRDNIARFILFDLHTPGEIDEPEGNWLADMLDRFGCGNSSEKALLKYIRVNAGKISGRFAGMA